jgi:dienelactone hydrolase
MRLLGSAIVAFVLAATGNAAAQFWPAETLEIPSRTFSDEAFLQGDAGAGEAVVLKASLTLPPQGGPHPIVVLLHGTDGPTSVSVSAWQSALSAMGYGTIRLDSYGGRGVTQISDNQAAVSQFTQIYDAFRLVEVLAADARVDANRIVLMGFSRGGTAALYASLVRFHDLYGPQAGKIVGYLPFYPACNFELAAGLDLVAVPVRQFHGAADDWTSASVCQAYFERLKAAGADAEITVFDGAYHAFDSPLARFKFVNETAQASFGCMRVELNGVLLNRDTGEPFSYDDACVTTGPAVQYDEAATKAAQASVAAFLADVAGAP